ncbi:MAG: formate dehydrogenase subunit delta [Comamonas sp.]
MDVNNLIRMANRIGEFFVSIPDRDEALEGIALHIQKFWDPRMRLRLLDALSDEQQAQQLLPLVRESLQLHDQQLRPKP